MEKRKHKSSKRPVERLDLLKCIYLKHLVLLLLFDLFVKP